jgi:DNA-binding CsgD family transcriptional regulator
VHSDEDALDALRVRIIVSVVLVVVAVGGATDLYFDAPRRWLTPHVLIEVTLMTVSSGLAVYLWRGWRRAAAGLAGVRESLSEREAERDAWRRRADATLAGLGRAIDEQFTAWQLTPSEREVALLLLKGHGHKQVAAATQRSERTVRQHAVAVYQKSGLGGRAELAAFFLEGLMLPGSATGPTR